MRFRHASRQQITRFPYYSRQLSQTVRNEKTTVVELFGTTVHHYHGRPTGVVRHSRTVTSNPNHRRNVKPDTLSRRVDMTDDDRAVYYCGAPIITSFRKRSVLERKLRTRYYLSTIGFFRFVVVGQICDLGAITSRSAYKNVLNDTRAFA